MTRAREDRTSALLRAMGELLFELTPEGVFTEVLGPPDLLFAPPERVVGRSIGEILPHEVAADSLRVIHQVAHDGKPRSVEYSLPMPHGLRTFEARIAPAGNGNLLALVRDVHTRRLAEDRLREDEVRLRLLADHAPVMLWRGGPDGRRDFFNRGWLAFTGPPAADDLDTGWAAAVHPEDLPRCTQVRDDAAAGRQPFRMEYRLRRADGEFRWVLDEGAPRFAPDGTLEGFIGSCVDITEIKEAGEQVRRLNSELSKRLVERDVLLREIHHRVKNNLQLISSILKLQARRIDAEARGVIDEVRIRVHSMALAHDKLHAIANTATVDLASYARDLVQFVTQTIGASPAISMRVEAESIELAVDQAIPCGLIINELVTNAYKHAFPGAVRGTIVVEIRRTGEAGAHIAVRDDGVGLPENFDPQRGKTLGLDLVRTLARQLDSQLEVERRSRGTSFGLTVKVEGGGR